MEGGGGVEEVRESGGTEGRAARGGEARVRIEMRDGTRKKSGTYVAGAVDGVARRVGSGEGTKSSRKEPAEGEERRRRRRIGEETVVHPRHIVR